MTRSSEPVPDEATTVVNNNAAAMDAEVEIHFAGPACELLVAGVAAARALDPAWRTLVF